MTDQQCNPNSLHCKKESAFKVTFERLTAAINKSYKLAILSFLRFILDFFAGSFPLAPPSK